MGSFLLWGLVFFLGLCASWMPAHAQCFEWQTGYGSPGLGLNGDATAKLVEIRWPSGTVQTFENVKARAPLVATEPASGAAAGTRR